MGALWLCLMAPALPASALDFSDCRVYDSSETRAVDAECATLQVAEDPSTPDGPQIELFVVRIPAIAPTPAPDPFTLIQGGPGGSSVDLYIAHAGAFERLREFRDIVLVDQRGTGRSNPLDCEAPEGAALDFDPEIARQMSRECLASMSADPRFYTTSVAVNDLEQLRQELGVAEWNLYGVSYGTRVALHYLRRYPQHARTVVIDGVAPADWVLGPDIARFGQQALDQLFERCAQDSDCQQRFGNLAQKFARLKARLESGAETVRLNHPVTGEPDESIFTVGHLVLVTRMLSYQSESLALLPLLITEAADNDNLEPMAAQALLIAEQLEAGLALGMHNAVVCTEDLPFIEDVSGLDQTYMGELQVQALRAMCADWPRGVIDEGFKTPVQSDRPVLVLSGQYDPVTPPVNAAQAARTLDNHLQLVAPGQGHGVVMRGCVPRLVARFVESAEPGDLQTDCIQRLVATPFFFSFSGPLP